MKTIGDAVMAAFACVDDAMAAALAMQRGVQIWCAGAGIEPPLVLKIGEHHGPALAVTANDRLDYFGRTVNVAARVAAAARGGDVVVVRELLDEEPLRRLLEVAGVRIEHLRVELRGVEAERELARIVVAADG